MRGVEAAFAAARSFSMALMEGMNVDDASHLLVSGSSWVFFTDASILAKYKYTT